MRADGGAAKDEEPLPGIAGRHEVDGDWRWNRCKKNIEMKRRISDGNE